MRRRATSKRQQQMRRAAELRRKTKLTSKPQTLRANTRLRASVMRRSEGLCEFLRWVPVHGLHAWVRCNAPAVDTAHIFKRADCGKAKYDPRCSLAACRACHERYDANRIGISVALDTMDEATKVIDKASKVKR
jgi:hypothetical protein